MFDFILIPLIYILFGLYTISFFINDPLKRVPLVLSLVLLSSALALTTLKIDKIHCTFNPDPHGVDDCDIHSFHDDITSKLFGVLAVIFTFELVRSILTVLSKTPEELDKTSNRLKKNDLD